ncbi:GtrA family protein [candidate division KSB1 bacterium]|nr:GtrA family protein [candidate division KSB1 bacterium]RQW10488.1 MAG: GtrA family protein [candidate division KSB1 bacterium]
MNNCDDHTIFKSDFISKNFNHFIKYSFVGIGNFLFTLVLYITFLYVLDFRYEFAFTLSWLLGVYFTYLINFIWVFKPEEKITFRKRLPKYFLVYISSYVLNMLLLKFLVDHFSLLPLLAQMFIIPLVVVINFIGIKYWALR